MNGFSPCRSPSVPVNGAADTVPSSIPTWEALNGAQGTVMTTSRFTVSYSPQPSITWFYSDDATPSADQCWGDSSYYGAAGPWTTSGIPTTDPVDSGYATLKGVRTNVFLPASTDGTLVTDTSTALAADIDTPLTVTPSAYTP